MRVLSPLVAFALIPALGLSACGKKGSVGVSMNPDVLTAPKSPSSTNVSSTCLDPTEVRIGREYTCSDGKKRKGVLVYREDGTSVPVCSADKEKSCLTTEDFSAFAKVERSKLAPGNVKQGVVIAAVTGTLTSSGPADCAADGEIACVSTSTFAAISTTGLASKIVTGSSVAGVAGSYVPDLPDVANVRASDTVGGVAGTLANCSSEGGADCVVSAGTSYRAASTTGLAAKVISTASVAGETGTVVLPGAGDVRVSVAYGPGSVTLGSYSPDFPDVANVRSSDTVAGVPGTLANCATDGGTNCVAVTGFPAANTANFNGWDIRRKRSSGGTVLTFAGLVGQSKTCRNQANTQTLYGMGPNQGYNNITSPGTAGLDFFDTIDDWNNNVLGLPAENPAWTMLIGGMTVTAGDDFKCGGIYATGDTATGKTGADDTLAHDSNGNWQDLTPMTVPGGALSAGANITVNSMSVSPGTVNGCNATDKHCVFKELISGLMVTEFSAANYTWANALDYCHTLGESGHPVVALRSPIPVIGASYTDWRLPTQKELMHLYQGGVRGLNQTSNLTTYFGTVNAGFWASSTESGDATYAWYVSMNAGYQGTGLKTVAQKVICVR